MAEAPYSTPSAPAAVSRPTLSARASESTPPAPTAGGGEGRFKRVARGWFRYLMAALATMVLATAALIAVQLWVGSQDAWAEFGPGFITSTAWNPVRGEFGALPFIAGTLLTSFMALLIALPVSLGIAILLAEYLPGPLRDPLIFMVELLAAIPSVVYGLWGIFALAPLMQAHVIPLIAASPLGLLPIFGEPGPGYTMLTASVILAVMIIPITASLSREVLLAVPGDQKEAALALGMTRWEAVRNVSLAYGMPGIFSAAVLGLARAMGETMAVTMTIGNRAALTVDFFQPAYTMTAIIANEFREAADEIHLSSLVAIGLVLFALSFVVNMLGRLLIARSLRRAEAL